MQARRFINAKDRAIGVAQRSDLCRIAAVPISASSSEKAFALMKVGLLLIEAALPAGAVDNRASGSWKPGYAAEWRKQVANASGPYTLMACSYLLEEVINPDWLDPHVVHILSCLPQRWKAIREASVSGLCLRVSLLDQAVNYNVVDKLKYAPGRRR